jgi:hypothetical protein
MYDPTQLMVQALQGRTEPTPAAPGMQLAGDVVPFPKPPPKDWSKASPQEVLDQLYKMQINRFGLSPGSNIENVIPLKRPE